MSTPLHNRPTPLITMADGTLKQVNPLTGTEVWTVPGRGNRPLSTPATDPRPLSDADHTSACAFCSDRLLQTPPEKSRMVRENGTWFTRPGLLPSQLGQSVAEFRRVPNLFEIVSFDYWRENYGFQIDPETNARMQDYLADPAGRDHVLSIVRTRLKAAGKPAEELEAMTEEQLLERAGGYFAGGHDLIIGRRHYVDGATHDNQLASSGTLSVDEHRALIRFTTQAVADLYARNRYAPYVAVFQNWLKPAGASFDHLHKQLVAIDERGVHAEEEIARLRANPNMYNEWAVDYANYHNLIIAENDYAVAFAGFGHRYPTLEIYSKSATPEPWLQTDDEIGGMSDLMHACHAATGPDVPCNEEWHHKPIDLDIPMPWRVMIKWRVSNLAGFEGGTKIYLNTLSPQNIRDRVVSAMFSLRDEGRIAPTIRIATEAYVERNCLKYNPVLR
ncbi:DUF4921 family protein [Corynebacterium kalinowskii]|nr:DUF4921 family protein [Corynebacterium kalinowskii]